MEWFRSVRRATFVVVSALVAGGGAAAIALSAAGAASAATTPGTCSGTQPSSNPTAGWGSTCLTNASVTIGTTVTISDNAPSLNWSTAVAGQSNAPADSTVGINVQSNDVGGYQVDVGAYGVNTPGGSWMSGFGCSFMLSGSSSSTPTLSNSIPMSGLSVKPNGGTALAGGCGAVPGGNNNVEQNYIPEETKSGPSVGGGDNYTDVWLLSIPSGTAPGVYLASIQYYALGN